MGRNIHGESVPSRRLTKQSCVTGEYAQHEQSQVVQTAWAILALVYGQYEDKEVIRRATKLIMGRQKRDGRWEQEDTEGIFNKNCAIDYPGECSWVGR
jgi:lanosterol synthase